MAEKSGPNTQDRPFRHLCPEADLRDAMSDGEFWDHVAESILGPGSEPDTDDMEPVGYDELDILAPCEVCGESGACGYDSEGRPLIHATPKEDE
jgi:hypothetical protein